MALSPAQQHLRRIQAQLDAQQRQAHEPMVGASAYTQQMAILHSDFLRLKQVQSIEAKAALKRELIPAYIPYLDGILRADSGAKDEVVMTCFAWSIDAQCYDLALRLADYVLRHHLTMPDRFARTTACFLAEEVADAADRARRAGQPFEAIAVLTQVEQLTATHDMPDPVRAKLLIAIARQEWIQAGDHVTPSVLDTIIGRFRRALALDAHCGCKKECEQAERMRKQSNDGASADTRQSDSLSNESSPSVPATRRPRPRLLQPVSANTGRATDVGGDQ